MYGTRDKRMPNILQLVLFGVAKCIFESESCQRCGLGLEMLNGQKNPENRSDDNSRNHTGMNFKHSNVENHPIGKQT